MFPPEIFSEIFSFLASEAHVLLACSQAHPIFAQIIEPILYAHVIVIIHDANYEDQHHLKFKPHQLSTLLSDNPRILNYLRSLCVDLSLLDDEVLTELVAILPRLKLERIQLTCTDFAHWNWFDVVFRTAFVAYISTSFMKEVCIDDIYGIPLSSFANCTGLKRLTLFDSVPQSNPGPFNFPQLETLELSDWAMRDHSPVFLSWLSTHACGLRSLTLTTCTKDVIQGFLPHLLAICSISLVNLSIYYTKTSKPIYLVTRVVLTPVVLSHNAGLVEIDFPRLPSLERLRLCTYTSSSEGFSNYLVHHALIMITQILQNLSSIKYLTLIICLRFGGDTTQIDWSPLADFLSDRRSSFQHTDLYVRAAKGGGEISSGEVISMLSRCGNLMSLVKAGYVSVKEEKCLDVHVDRYFNTTLRSLDLPVSYHNIV